jgi:Zn-finger nucleic acid-binding protein
MVEESRRRIVMDRCTRCGGYWIDRVALAACIKATGSQLEVTHIALTVATLQGPETSLRCPPCDLALQAAELEGVILEICPRCSGVFLDPGELETMIASRRRQHRQEQLETGRELLIAILDDLLAAILEDLLAPDP